uniref:Chromosome 1 open reading frame 116 n=1 Tax=Apteryx owenii TaxID=8824 RepID=A0A8B9PRN1_APTOW
MAAAAGDVPKKGLWLGMASCNSGSCDSMASTTSNRSERSDNSYDYLSVEEKECLMFLEETIGSLDAEADSGVSTDETDSAEPAKLPGTWPKRDSGPRDLENGEQSIGQQRATQQKSEQKASAFSSSAPAAAPSLGYYSLPRNIAAASAPRANGASDSKAAARTMGDPAPAERPLRETAEEERLDRASARAPAKPPGSMTIPPPEASRDAQAARGGLTLSEGLDAGGEPVARDTGMERESAAAAQGWPEKLASEEDSDTKRGPPTAPKPRKLPPNIILKTSRNSLVPLSAEPGHGAKSPPPVPAGCAAADRVNAGHRDPKERERARREALEKLGLPRDKREPDTPSKAAARPEPEEVPGAGLRATGRGALAGSPERAAPGARHVGFKSNTLERSGVGLGSYMAGKEQGAKSSGSLGKMSFMERITPSFLRSGRPRPASLGTRKDFAGLAEQGGARRPQALPGPSRAARSSCVSVKISPRGAPEEHRREALRKLGLLKD